MSSAGNPTEVESNPVEKDKASGDAKSESLKRPASEVNDASGDEVKQKLLKTDKGECMKKCNVNEKENGESEHKDDDGDEDDSKDDDDDVGPEEGDDFDEEDGEGDEDGADDDAEDDDDDDA